MPIYIAPSFVKLFLLLYSGLGEVEGRERNRKKKFNPNPSTSVLQPCGWQSKDQFLNLIIWNVKGSFTGRELHANRASGSGSVSHPERSQLPGATASSPGDAWVCGRISGLTIQVFVCSAFL